MEAEKKMAQARVTMLIDHPFFGHLAMFLRMEERNDLDPPTMATDGQNLYYHPAFVAEVSQEELSGVIAHEVGHVMLRHPERIFNRELERWNAACDFGVNDLVMKEFRLPSGVLYCSAFADRTVDWIYDHLPQTEGTEYPLTLDSHREWSEWGKGSGTDGRTGQVWQERIAQAANLARMRGKLPGYLETLVDGILRPRLDWKTILRDMITSAASSDYRLVPPNRKHLWRELYLPSLTGEEISIGVAVDSSGSVSDEEITRFLSEIKGICDSYENYTIYLFVADTHIRQRFELHPFDPLPRLITGRGGTSFVEVIEEAAKLPISALVYMTDLAGAFPQRELAFPVIWVVTDSEAEAPWGQVIRMPE